MLRRGELQFLPADHQMKRERDPTPEEYEKLLAWLDPERSAAGKKLITIHSRLTQILVARGASDAESLADEIINRVAVRIDRVMTSYPIQINCFLGFVDNVSHEDYRDQLKIMNLKPPPPPRSPAELENEDTCLAQCLETLSASERNLFVRYFRDEDGGKIDNRKKLAADLELSANGLRIKAHRIRKKMRLCVKTCLNELDQ